MSNYEVIGRCGNCGGEVRKETGPLYLVGPWPRPRCVRCGATVEGPQDRVLKMNPKPTR